MPELVGSEPYLGKVADALPRILAWSASMSVHCRPASIFVVPGWRLDSDRLVLNIKGCFEVKGRCAIDAPVAPWLRCDSGVCSVLGLS